MRQNSRRSGLGSGGYCICPKCGNEIRHIDGKPCTNMICDLCKTTMIRKTRNVDSLSHKRIAVIDKNKCTGCGRCVEVCPVNAISLVNGIAVIDETICLGCMKCSRVCPVNAISSSN